MMTADNWHKQGDILGSMTTIQDWIRTMHANSNEPGTVQAHIERSLNAKEESTTYWQNDPKHNVDPTNVEINRKAGCHSCYKDPIVFALEYHAAETKALEELKAERKALQTMLNGLAF